MQVKLLSVVLDHSSPENKYSWRRCGQVIHDSNGKMICLWKSLKNNSWSWKQYWREQQWVKITKQRDEANLMTKVNKFRFLEVEGTLTWIWKEKQELPFYLQERHWGIRKCFHWRGDKKNIRTGCPWKSNVKVKLKIHSGVLCILK